MSAKTVSQQTLARMLSLLLLGGSILLFWFDRMMAIASLIEALLLLVTYGSDDHLPVKACFALPCLPAILYHFYRLWLFARAGSINLYFFEVGLLGITYLLAAILICANNRPKSLRWLVLALFVICIGFGIWDIIDGWWVLQNHTWTPLGQRLHRFVFYYLPDTLFWILPFVIMGRHILHQR